MESSFPDETKSFIRDHISSVEMLEILLFLLAHRGKAFSVGEVLKEIQSSRDSVTRRLAELDDTGLVREGPEGYEFLPRSPELEEAVHSLKNCYTIWRVKVIETIYSRQSDGIQKFSDAFRFRRKK